MRRGYTAERYLPRLVDARAAIADLAVTTDIIVGFPGETEEDFDRTLEVASAAEYDSAYTFIFSPRPGTRAAQMTELYVPPESIADRFERLKVVIERSALARNLSRIGMLEQAIVEGPSKKDPEVLSGRTRQGKLLHFAPLDGHGLAPGTFVERARSSARRRTISPGVLVSVGARRGRRGSASGSRWSPAEAPVAETRPRDHPIRGCRGGSVQWAVVSVFGKVLRAGESKKVRSLAAIVPSINALEPEIQALSDAELARKTVEFKERMDHGEDMNDLLVEAFAVVREAGVRTIGQRHFDVQLMGGMALHFGWIAEMKTGEGKTLVSTLPVYLNALGGRGRARHHRQRLPGPP